MDRISAEVQMILYIILYIAIFVIGCVVTGFGGDLVNRGKVAKGSLLVSTGMIIAIGAIFLHMHLEKQNFRKEYGHIIARCLPSASFDGGKEFISKFRAPVLVVNRDGTEKIDLPARGVPSGVMASHSGHVNTVIFLSEKREYVGKYSDNEKAYRTIFNLCAVNAESGRLAARAIIVGEPAAHIYKSKFSSTSAVGDTKGARSAASKLAMWIVETIGLKFGNDE